MGRANLNDEFRKIIIERNKRVNANPLALKTVVYKCPVPSQQHVARMTTDDVLGLAHHAIDMEADRDALRAKHEALIDKYDALCAAVEESGCERAVFGQLEKAETEREWETIAEKML